MGGLNLDLIINPLIVAGIGAVLAALITIIDGVVNNYGDVQIDINDGKETRNVKGGSPLLLTLSEQEIFIPSACGGRGTCGACKLKVKSDIGPIYPTEKPFMSPEEEKENTRLSCQIKVKSDLKIEIPEELFNVKQFDAAVKSIKDVTHDIKEIQFKLNNSEKINFQAGQYMQFEAPAYEKVKDATQRAYSISSKPVDDDMVELLIRLVPGGIVTSYVFNYLKEGQKVRLIGPFGDFVVQETGADMICVAGGSGMAPIKSIVYDMLQNAKTDRHVWYFFGARCKRDLFYLDEFKEIEKQWRSEERRVGKECRSRWSPYH